MATSLEINMDPKAGPDVSDAFGLVDRESGHLSQLIAQMNACLADSASQTIGTFAQTLEAIHAELALMVDQPLGDEVYDWDAILADGAALEPDGSTGSDTIVPFTTAQLAMLTT